MFVSGGAVICGMFFLFYYLLPRAVLMPLECSMAPVFEVNRAVIIALHMLVGHEGKAYKEGLTRLHATARATGGAGSELECGVIILCAEYGH